MGVNTLGRFHEQRHAGLLSRAAPVSSTTFSGWVLHRFEAGALHETKSESPGISPLGGVDRRDKEETTEFLSRRFEVYVQPRGTRTTGMYNQRL